MSCDDLTLTPTVFADNITAQFIFNLLLFACSLTSVPQNLQIHVHAPSGGTSLTDLKVGHFLVWRSANISTINLIISPRKAEWFYCFQHFPPLMLPLKSFLSIFFLIRTKIPGSFSADCPPKMSGRALICISSVRAQAGATETDQNQNLTRPWRSRGMAATPSQEGRFHNISIHPNPKENCSKFHLSQRTAVSVDSKRKASFICWLLWTVPDSWGVI